MKFLAEIQQFGTEKNQFREAKLEFRAPIISYVKNLQSSVCHKSVSNLQ